MAETCYCDPETGNAPDAHCPQHGQCPHTVGHNDAEAFARGAQEQRDADVATLRSHKYGVTPDPSYNDGVNAGLQTAAHVIEHAPLITARISVN